MDKMVKMDKKENTLNFILTLSDIWKKIFTQKNMSTSSQYFTQSILKMMLKDVRPHSLVDGETFKEINQTFNPDSILSSITHFLCLGCLIVIH